MFDKLYQAGNTVSMSEIFGGDTPAATATAYQATTLVGAGNGDCQMIGDGTSEGRSLIIFGEQCTHS